MRIVIPVHSFEPGGVERVALRLAERWREAGHEVVIVLGRDRGPCRMTAPDLDYRTRREPFATDRWETLWMIWSLLQVLFSERADIVFCPGSTYTVVCVAMKWLLGDLCPPVLVKISNDLERRDLPPVARQLYRWWLRLQGAWLERFVAIAQPMQEEIERELALPPGRTCVIADPALSERDLAALADCRKSEERPEGCRYLTIGRLAGQKNQALLIEAFARHARPQDSLTIAGDGPKRASLVKLASDLGVGSRVDFAGHVDDVLPLFAAADVFVLSSHYEGAPAVIIEALAAGTPIATTDCCVSMDWLTGHGQFGVVVAPGARDALGSAMNAARTMQLDREAMKRLAATFTLERSGELYLREFEHTSRNFFRQRTEELQGSARIRSAGGV